MPDNRHRERDLLARVLELGTVAVVLFAPWPLGAVGPQGRLALELAAGLLGLIWLTRALARQTPLPGRAVRAGIVGLLLLAVVQTLPVGPGVVSTFSPRATEIRATTVPYPEALEAEQRVIGVEPASLDATATFSVDRSATASALRTGAALAVLLLVAFCVAATRGVRALATALLVSASFQGLYGLLVLASGHDKIWHYTKNYYLNSATGTFVNRNHFACFVAMGLACGMALILYNARRRRRVQGARNRLVALFGGEGSRNLLLGVLLVVALAGLLASLSRAGTALGLLALVLTLLAAGRKQGLRTRIVVGTLIVAVAAVPLLQMGSDRLVGRFSSSAADLTASGGRSVVWGDTLTLAAAFPVTGCGYGTFSAVYPVFRSAEVRAFYAHAHNDLLQALAEGGVIGMALLLLILVPLLRTLVRALGGAKGTLAVGLAAGLLAFLLHELVDFNGHIPANAATASILAGALLGLPWKTDA